MIVFPNCKINLGLHIIRKREDNYHDLETVFYPVPLCDALELRDAEASQTKHVNLISEGLPVQGDAKENLVSKAYQLLQKDYALPYLQFALLKNIPMGAGLGGGSSDGAFALNLLNAYLDLNLGEEKLLHYAAQLGSDCAFFINNKPCLGSGRGEILKPIDLSLKGYWIVIIKPEIHISTAEAFATIDVNKHQNQWEENSIKNIIKLDPSNWKDRLCNDFEDSIFPKHPLLATIKNSLYQAGAIYASMSGSGSSIFGLFRFEPRLKESYREYFYFEGLLD